MDRSLMKNEGFEDIEMLDWVKNENYEAKTDDDIAFTPGNSALAPLYEKLRTSERGGLHLRKGNSSYYNAVMDDMDRITAMMGTGFTTNPDRNLESIANMQRLYTKLSDDCDAYTERGARTRAGKARADIVREIKNIASRDIYTLGAVYTDFSSMPADRQAEKTWNEIIGEGRIMKLTVSDYSTLDTAGGGQASEVYKISDKDGKYTGQDEGMQIGLQFFKPEDAYYLDPGKNKEALFSEAKIRFPGLTDDDLEKMSLKYDKDTREAPFISITKLSDVGQKAWQYIAAKKAGQETQQSEIIRPSGMQGDGEKINMSRRNVATSRVASLLGLESIVAHSETVDIHDEKTGRTVRGNLMQGATGKKGDEITSAYKKSGSTGLIKTSGGVTRDLISLQVLDVICGQMDRHANNILFKTDETGITGLTAIDNDASFSLNEDIVMPKMGQRHDRRVVNKETGKLSIPFMDKKLADRISSLSPSALKFALAGLLADDEIEAAMKRFEAVKNAVGQSADTTEFLENESDWNEERQKAIMAQSEHYAAKMNAETANAYTSPIIIAEYIKLHPEYSDYNGEMNTLDFTFYIGKKFPGDTSKKVEFSEFEKNRRATFEYDALDKYKAYGTYYGRLIASLSGKPLKSGYLGF